METKMKTNINLQIADIYKRFLVQYRKLTVVILTLKVNSLKAKLSRTPKKTFLFYPQQPVLEHALSHICRFNGFEITTSLKTANKADFIIFFEDKTYRKPDDKLAKINNKHRIINFYSRNI